MPHGIGCYLLPSDLVGSSPAPGVHTRLGYPATCLSPRPLELLTQGCTPHAHVPRRCVASTRASVSLRGCSPLDFRISSKSGRDAHQPDVRRYSSLLGEDDGLAPRVPQHLHDDRPKLPGKLAARLIADACVGELRPAAKPTLVDHADMMSILALDAHLRDTDRVAAGAVLVSVIEVGETSMNHRHGPPWEFQLVRSPRDSRVMNGYPEGSLFRNIPQIGTSHRHGMATRSDSETKRDIRPFGPMSRIVGAELVDLHSLTRNKLPRIKLFVK